MRPQTKPFIVEIRRSGSARKPDARLFDEESAPVTPKFWAEADRVFAKPPASPQCEPEPSGSCLTPQPAPRVFHVDAYEDPVQALLKAAEARRGRPKRAAIDSDEGDEARPLEAKRPKPVEKTRFVARNDGWDDLRRLWSR